jgi:hypothetical protein
MDRPPPNLKRFVIVLDPPRPKGERRPPDPPQLELAHVWHLEMVGAREP